MPDRRTFVGRVAAGLLAVPLAVRAQKTGRIYRLGTLAPGARSSRRLGLTGLLATHLHEMGYTEGRNLEIETRFAEEDVDQLPRLARELVQLKPDAIVALGTPAIRACRSATITVPIVFLTNGDPVAAGWVASLARPGGNVTGMLITPEGTLAEVKLALLKELVPTATRVALLAPDKTGGETSMQVQEVRKAARLLNLEIIVIEVQGGDYVKAFSTISATRLAALVVGSHSRFTRDRQKIIELAAMNRLPAIYEWPQQVKDGGLMSYGASDTETYRRVASYVDRIFKGATASELPIEMPSKLLLVINLKAARTMGLTVPRSLLVRADELIE